VGDVFEAEKGFVGVLFSLLQTQSKSQISDSDAVMSEGEVKSKGIIDLFKSFATRSLQTALISEGEVKKNQRSCPISPKWAIFIQSI